MKTIIAAAIAACLAIAHAPVDAKAKPGTGAKAQSTKVKGYTTKKGKHVAAHRRTTPDHSKRNNYSAPGNSNPNGGKSGKK